ncbi:MAG: PEP-CTERM sorting domain-containing protein [Acidobacteria bacterium]|nr:PEP-CTERM sorting domain-containing protein [Acidobacteriota bacterium]
MKRLIRISPFLLLVLFTAGSVYADSLASLFNGGSIIAGDKLFDNWELLYYDASDGRCFDPNNIEVTALNDGGMSPGPGLDFYVSNGELNVSGDGIYAYVDLMFGFRVSVLDPAMTITDNTLGFSAAGAYLSWLIDDSFDLGNYIRESIGTAAGLDDLGAKEVEFSTLKFPGATESFTSIISDSAAFAPQSEIWITKNVLVWAVDDSDGAGITGFEQRFSQSVVPEPSTLLLVGLGIAGLAAFRRSRKR